MATKLRIDHLVLAGRDLDSMRSGFAAVGLAPDAGGTHADGLTHNALLGFADGSYLELIAPTPGSDVSSHHWGRAMLAGAGVCAWAIRSDDLERDAALYRARGTAVGNPRSGGRVRPDGARLEWITAPLGSGPPGMLLPFLIQDVTPRELRVPRSASAEGIVSGAAGIVIGAPAEQVDGVVEQLRRAFELPKPAASGPILSFAETPITVVQIGTPGIEPSEARAALLPGPLMALLRTPDLLAARNRLSALEAPTQAYFGRTLWFAPRVIDPAAAQLRIGLTDRP